MARYRTIVPAIWDDLWFSDLPKESKLYWLYLLTNRNTDASGLYRLNPRLAAPLLGISQPATVRARRECTDAGKAIFHDEWVLIVNYVRHQPAPNLSIWRHILDQLRRAPDQLQMLWLHHNRDRIPAELMDIVPTPCPQGEDRLSGTETVQRQRQRQKTTSGEPSEKLGSPPDFDGLKLYTDGQQKGIKALWRTWPDLKAATAEAYPGIDLLAELRAAHAWEVANPKKRKTDKVRFLHNWFARAQDKPAAGRSHKETVQEQVSRALHRATGGKHDQ